MGFLSARFMSASIVLLALVSSAHSRGAGLPGYGIEQLDPIDLSQLKSGFGDETIRKVLVPYYVDEVLSTLANDRVWIEDVLLSGVKNMDCKGHVWEWLVRVLNLKKQVLLDDLWVLHMFDAWGKPPEGLLTGHVNALGDFDECVDTAVTNLKIQNPNAAYSKTKTSFEGRYCNTFLAPYNAVRFGKYFKNVTAKSEDLMKFLRNTPKESVSPGELIELIKLQVGVRILPSLAICFPNTCDKTDMEQIMVNAFDLLYTPVYGSFPKESLLWPAVESCYDAKKPDLDAGDISVIVMLCIILFLCLVASLVDMALNRGLEKPPIRGLAFQYLNSFSLYTNIPKWLNTRASADDLGCLHGIRVLSTSWVILAHTWYVITFIPFWNSTDVKQLTDGWMILTILNSTVSVDTFFVMSGLLVAFNVLKLLHKTKGKLNIPMFYVHRYLRLTPVYAVLIGIMATLVPYLGRGPYWIIMDRWGSFCETNWWTNMLYVNNFVNTSWLCQGEAWYLANDMQFYIVSPLIMYPLYQWEMIGVVLLSIFTILSSLSPALMVYYMKTVPTTIGTRDSSKWFLDIYIKPYARIQTFLVGIWLGWLLFKTKGKQVKLPLPLVLLFWVISTGTVAAVLYGIHPWFDPTNEIPRIPSMIYAGLNRLAWAISISWIIFACVKGYGWIINDFLSWSAFIPLGRLCYCVFLVSLHLQMVLHTQFKHPEGYSSYSMVNFFFGHLVMSFIVGFVFTLTIETPCMLLVKLLFEGGAKPTRVGGNDKPPDGKTVSVSCIPQGQGGNPSGRNGIYYNPPESISNGPAKSVQDKND